MADAARRAPRCCPRTPMSPSWARRQQQQETAARLCMLEGMLLDAEDTFMEQASPKPNPNPDPNPAWSRRVARDACRYTRIHVHAHATCACVCALCMLVHMHVHVHVRMDTFIEQTGRARELDAELRRVERLLGTEAIKRGRDRRMVEATGRGAATPTTANWDKWISKLPL